VGSTRGGASRAHLLFLFLIGFAGWAAIASTMRAGAQWPSLEAAALFLVVIAGTRSLSFPLAGLDGDAEISLDSAIFIAATACLGGPVTAAGVGVLLSADAVVRAVRAPRHKTARHREGWSVAAHAIYGGGLSGGLIALLSRLFMTSAPVNEAWRVPALGASFLVGHYLIQTVQLRLDGQSWRASIRRNTIGVVCEATLVPLACAIVLIWDPRHPVPFALLGGTYLLVNFGFNRLAHLAKAMRQRALELETLNRTAHALGNSLEAPQLIGALLREAVRALPAAHRLEAIVSHAGKVERFITDARGNITVEAASVGARAWLKLKEPVVDERDGEDRLGVPLIMYGETIGALVATSSEDGAFGPNEMRLLDAIAGQAATAVENARLYTLANIDGLTGLYVRRYFDLRVAEEVERARRFSSSFALVLLDLDDFKRLNDTLGHLAGDRALREVAAISASQLRGVDLAARYGGEELAFLLPRTSLVDAHAVAERIRAAVASHRIVENGRAMTVTASIGVAAWAESGVDDPQSLIARADAALYRAKAAGKNQVQIDLVTFELTPSLAPIRRRRA
jgi:diguanylate cyclase (GGDEF)-like protein